MFAINKKEAQMGTQRLFKKADPSNRLRQNHLNFEASLIRSRLSELNFFKKKTLKNSKLENINQKGIVHMLLYMPPSSSKIHYKENQATQKGLNIRLFQHFASDLKILPYIIGAVVSGSPIVYNYFIHWRTTLLDCMAFVSNSSA